MPIRIIRDDITKVQCDAIVNAANKTLLGGGGVDGAIHKAAGIGLFFDCLKLRGCKVGEAKITPAHKLPCKYVIHTVGPKWKNGNNQEDELLASCYKNSLLLAKENNCESVAFPLISTGVYKFPKDRALQVAVNSISEFLVDNDMDVTIVFYEKSDFQIDKDLNDRLSKFIEENQEPDWRNITAEIELPEGVAFKLNYDRPSRRELKQAHRRIERGRRRTKCYARRSKTKKRTLDKIKTPVGFDISKIEKEIESFGHEYRYQYSRKEKPPVREQENANECNTNANVSIDVSKSMDSPWSSFADAEKWFDGKLPQGQLVHQGSGAVRHHRLDLEEKLQQKDESFTQALFRMIDERGWTDPQCYKKANVDRKLFSKMRCEENYHPKKTTAIAFAIALELSYEETQEFIGKAGYTLTRSSELDLIVEFFIEEKNYNVMAINSALFDRDQKLLG